MFDHVGGSGWANAALVLTDSDGFKIARFSAITPGETKTIDFEISGNWFYTPLPPPSHLILSLID